MSCAGFYLNHVHSPSRASRCELGTRIAGIDCALSALVPARVDSATFARATAADVESDLIAELHRLEIAFGAVQPLAGVPGTVAAIGDVIALHIAEL